MDYLNFPHGGNIYNYGKDILDFSANINPLGFSDRIKRKITKNLGTIRHYPDPYSRELIKEIADYWKIKEENILLGNGSVELIYLVVSALRPKKVLIPCPTFSEYEQASRLVKARVQFIRLKEGFILNIPKHTEADMVFISNPNNPTANLLINPVRNLRFINGANKNLKPRRSQFFVIDEAFMDFLPEEKKYTLIHKAEKDRGIIVLRSFTKFFALPGLRIGYLVAHKDLVKRLRRHLIPWNVNTLAQLAAKEVLRDSAYIARTRGFIERERAFLFNQIKIFKNLEPYPSVTNFILIKIKDAAINSSFLKESLLGKGILIRDCSNFRNLGNKHFRIAVRTRKENLKLISALKELW